MYGIYHFLQIPQVPLPWLQCLQYLQFLQALQGLAPVQVANLLGTLADRNVIEISVRRMPEVMVFIFIFLLY